jgi:putative serine protease PepD
MTDRFDDQPAPPDHGGWQRPNPDAPAAGQSGDPAAGGSASQPAPPASGGSSYQPGQPYRQTPPSYPSGAASDQPGYPGGQPGYPGGQSGYPGGQSYYQSGYQPTYPGGQPTEPTEPPQPTQTYGGYPNTGYGYPTAAYPQYSPQYATQYPQPGYGTPATSAPPAEPRRRVGSVIAVAAVTAAVFGGGVGAGVAALVSNDSNNGGLSISNASAKQSPKVDGSISAAAAVIQPSVVTINVDGAQESGTGSGVIIRSDGYILTNDHVVAVAANGGTMSVVTNDGQQTKATLVGADPSDDLAVVKVVGLSNLKAATFGKSANLIVGQAVVAVGAPLGLSDTVTSGIVSNVARPVITGDSTSASSQTVFDAVQTDAAINPGNSGGPLVDLNGHVVGINAAIATAGSGGLQLPGQPTQQSGSIGIGFAIPADEASRIANELITTGKATHAVIGVTVQDNSSGTGATIKTVTANSAAADAGMQAGDVVTKVGTQLISDDTSLIAAIRSRAPGETVDVTFTRGGSAETVKVKLGSATN